MRLRRVGDPAQYCPFQGYSAMIIDADCHISPEADELAITIDDLLARMELTLEIIRLEEVRLRQELINYRSDTYDFMASLRKRADERRESFLRGVSIEPLVVNGDNMELMDGYTRYVVLKEYRQESIYAYVGRIDD